MTSYSDALRAADLMNEQLQVLVTTNEFVPRLFETLFGLHAAAASARDAFAARHSSTDGELPLFASVFDRCEQATDFALDVEPVEAQVARLTSFVERAIAAMQDATELPPRSGLRGTLRLRIEGKPRQGIRPGKRPQAPEPYYTSLVKLFPVEAVTLYPLAIGIAGADTIIRLLLIGVITLFVVALRWFGTQEESGGEADRLAITVSVVSFLLYAASLGGFGYLPGGPEQTRQLLAFLTIMWVALVPFALRRARR